MAIYSHSKIETFVQCKQKFKFQYIDKIKSDIESIEAFLGKCVHEVLEKLYKDLQFEKLNTKQQLLLHFEELWNNNWHNKIQIVKNYSKENYKSMGLRFISDYYDHYKPFNSLRTIHLETQDLMPLEDGNLFHIRIDRLACDENGIYYVCDYKTNNRLKAQDELDEDKQLAMYSLWIKQKYKDAKDVKLVWYFLAHDKEMLSERSNEQLEKLKQEIKKLIKQIETCDNFPTTISPLCSYCQYKNICPGWKHEIELEQKTNEKFKKDYGLKLIDEFAYYDTQEKQASAKKQKLREQIIAYAEQKQINTIWGTEKKAKLTQFTKTTYPKTNDFIDLLKQKQLFDKVVTINTAKLNSQLTKHPDTDILNQVTQEKGWMLRLSKR